MKEKLDGAQKTISAEIKRICDECLKDQDSFGDKAMTKSWKEKILAASKKVIEDQINGPLKAPGKDETNYKYACFCTIMENTRATRCSTHWTSELDHVGTVSYINEGKDLIALVDFVLMSRSEEIQV
eukprot:TRINITY_DN5781_c0_g1_i2.p1 TRINITY_DN5781_c0_g1~~TRINITY_DN5781_c0_g1_i2.p1  ORF type:complete len:127 (-),score=30.78 TRINITY_DN5781_c0_g1_i2:92-472(-)